MAEITTDIALRYTDVKTKKTQEVVIKECLITINQERNIIDTAIEGRSGTIKEYISDGDYQITLEVGISNDLDFFDVDNNIKHQEYPLDKVKAFLDILRINDALIVDSWFLKNFGVYSIVVKNFSTPQETHSNRQSITVNCLSDDAYEIKIMNENYN